LNSSIDEEDFEEQITCDKKEINKSQVLGMRKDDLSKPSNGSKPSLPVSSSEVVPN